MTADLPPMLKARSKGSDMNKEEMERLRQETLREVEAAEKEAADNKARFDAQKAEEKRLLDAAIKSWVDARGRLDAAIKEVNRKWTLTGVNFFVDGKPDTAPVEASVGKVAVSFIRPTEQFESKNYLLVYGTPDHRVVFERLRIGSPDRSILETMHSDQLSEERAEGLLGELLLLNKRAR